MSLYDWYPGLKHAHVGLVAASVGLFALRGAGVLAGAGWPMAAAVRRASVVVDVLLLTAGITLAALLRLAPWQHAWLGTKLLLLVVYIVLGSFALKRAATRPGKAIAFAAALGAAGCIVLIALAHDAAAPLAVFGLYGGPTR